MATAQTMVLAFSSMKRATLYNVDPHLRDPVQFREYLVRSVAGSTAIETGENVEAIARDLRKFLDAGSPPLKARRRR